jgi:hypothetical protein
MTMHLVRGMTTISTRKRKSSKKTAAVLEEERKTAILLKSLGYVKSGKKVRMTDFPDYTVAETVPTSDLIMKVEGKRKANQYTGDEIAGIGTLHKSNSVPIRKDSNDAYEIARMRRG